MGLIKTNMLGLGVTTVLNPNPHALWARLHFYVLLFNIYGHIFKSFFLHSAAVTTQAAARKVTKTQVNR